MIEVLANKRTMEFDQYGHLQPYEPIQTDWITFERILVEEFPESLTRQQLFHNYQQWVNEMKQLLNTGFTLWIDGSFVTRKTDPNDMDVVAFVNYQNFQQEKLLFYDAAALKQTRHLDVYFVAVYPPEHANHYLTQFNEMKWLDVFGYDRPDKANYIHRKGWLKLDY